MTYRDVDLTIVGGSFAGLACAAEAASRGVSVIVLDRKREPGAQCHTTGILVKEVADVWDVPLHLVRRVPGVRLYAPNGSSVDLHSAGYHFHVTDTPALMRWFASHAASHGARMQYGTTFDGAFRDGNRIVIDSAGITTNYLVGAGGPVRPFHGKNVLLIGDAAGLVSPLTAGGIHTALHYGHLAGVALADHLLDGGPAPAPLMRRAMPRFTTKRILRQFADLPIPNRLIDVALSNSVVRATAQTVFFHHRGLWSPRAWRDMAQIMLDPGRVSSI